MKELIDDLKDLQDPYPVEMNKTIENDEDYVALVPDPKIRTAISWYLCGEAFRTTKRRIIDLVEFHEREEALSEREKINEDF